MKDDELNTVEGAINAIYMTLQGAWEGWSNAYQVEAEEAHWLELCRLAQLGAAVEAMPPMLGDPRNNTDEPQYIQLGYSAWAGSKWDVGRWLGGDIYEEDGGPIGHGNTPAEALADAQRNLDRKS